MWNRSILREGCPLSSGSWIATATACFPAKGIASDHSLAATVNGKDLRRYRTGGPRCRCSATQLREQGQRSPLHRDHYFAGRPHRVFLAVVEYCPAKLGRQPYSGEQHTRFPCGPQGRRAARPPFVSIATLIGRPTKSRRIAPTASRPERRFLTVGYHSSFKSSSPQSHGTNSGLKVAAIRAAPTMAAPPSIHALVELRSGIFCRKLLYGTMSFSPHSRVATIEEGSKPVSLPTFLKVCVIFVLFPKLILSHVLLPLPS